MKTASATKLCLLALLAAMPAGGPARGQANRSEVDALRSSLLEVLSLATFGAVEIQEQAPEVTRSGADYRVRMPLNGFSAPPDAALEAVARPLAGGVWDIISMTIPPAGTVEPATHDGGTNRIDYTLGEQAIQARIDPAFGQTSTFAAAFGGVRLNSDQDGIQSQQAIDRYSVEGKVSAETAGRVTFMSGNKAENWRLTSRMPDGAETNGFIRTMAAHLTLGDVDRSQGVRFLAASRALLAATQQTAPNPGPDEPSGISVAQRQALHDMIDATPGLMTKFEADQTLDGIRFSATAASRGTINRLHLNLRGNAANERLIARIEGGVDGFALNDLSGETASYVPRHVEIKSALSGVRIGPLMALLRAAIAPDADPDALQDQVIQLLNDPDTAFAIDSVNFDSGPLRLTGSARVVQHPGGPLGAAIHLSATGVDAMIAQAQKTPTLQPALPMMFMAKGMGRPEGVAVVWDIALGNGPMTINGVPFGQPPGRTR